MYLMKIYSNQEHLQNGQCSAVRQEEFILPTDNQQTDIHRLKYTFGSSLTSMEGLCTPSLIDLTLTDQTHDLKASSFKAPES